MGIDTSGQLRTIVKNVTILNFYWRKNSDLFLQAVCERNLRPRVDQCPWPDRLKSLLKVSIFLKYFFVPCRMLTELAQRMWHANPEQRPYVREVLESVMTSFLHLSPFWRLISKFFK
jgi:hypothetical protein